MPLDSSALTSDGSQALSQEDVHRAWSLQATVAAGEDLGWAGIQGPTFQSERSRPEEHPTGQEKPTWQTLLASSPVVGTEALRFLEGTWQAGDPMLPR